MTRSSPWHPRVEQFPHGFFDARASRLKINPGGFLELGNDGQRTLLDAQHVCRRYHATPDKHCNAMVTRRPRAPVGS